MATRERVWYRVGGGRCDGKGNSPARIQRAGLPDSLPDRGTPYLINAMRLARTTSPAVNRTT